MVGHDRLVSLMAGTFHAHGRGNNPATIRDLLLPGLVGCVASYLQGADFAKGVTGS